MKEEKIAIMVALQKLTYLQRFFTNKLTCILLQALDQLKGNLLIWKFAYHSFQALCILYTIFKLISMSIFQPSQNAMSFGRPFTITKSQRFRLDIREKQHRERFQNVRKQFFQSFKSLSFLKELKEERDNISAQKIVWFVQGLQNGLSNAKFYQSIIDLQLQPYLCEMIMKKEIALEHKAMILRSLIQLLYYCYKLPKQFIDNNLIDYLRIQIGQMDICQQIGETYIFYVATLVLNLTNFLNSQFNMYMAESDLIPTLQKLVDENKNYIKSDLRQTIIKIYFNIFKSKPKSFDFILKALEKILIEQNVTQRQCRIWTMKCLKETAKIPNFWYNLLHVDYISTSVSIFYDGTVCILQKQFDSSEFGSLVDFLNELFDNDVIVREFTNQMMSFMPPKFLLSSMGKLKECQERTLQKKVLSDFVKLCSRLPNLFKSVYHKRMEMEQFIEMLMTRYLVGNERIKKFMARVILKVLEQDKTALDIFINNGIVDAAKDLLDTQFPEDSSIDVIDMIQKLIEIEQEMISKNSVNKMLNVFEDRGIIRDIQKLQQSNVKEIYVRAENFMSFLGLISEKRSKQ